MGSDLVPVGASTVLTLDVALTLLAGVLTIFTSAVVLRPEASATTKRVTAGVITVVMALIGAAVRGEVAGFPPDVQAVLVDAVLRVGAAIMAAQSLYKQFKPLLDLIAGKLNVPLPSVITGAGQAPESGATLSSEDPETLPPS